MSYVRASGRKIPSLESDYLPRIIQVKLKLGYPVCMYIEIQTNHQQVLQASVMIFPTKVLDLLTGRLIYLIHSRAAVHLELLCAHLPGIPSIILKVGPEF